MTKTIEFFYDVVSPWSYLASTQIEQVAKRQHANLQYRPFLLGGVFKATHNQAPMTVPAKGAHMLIDLKRWAERYGVTLNMPSNFPVSSLLAMRCLTALETKDLPEATKKLFNAFWVEGQDISERYTIIDLLGENVLQKANHDITKEKLKTTTTEAVKRGAFGAPTFFIADEMFFGSDRLDMLEHYLQSL